VTVVVVCLQLQLIISLKKVSYIVFVVGIYAHLLIVYVCGVIMLLL